MTALHQSRAQRFLLLATLIVGAVIFALPFLNMVSTSVKLDEELGAEHFHLLPKRPIPRAVSPYAMTQGDDMIERPADLPPKTWEAFRGPFVQVIQTRIGAWWDRQPAAATLFKTVERAAAVHTLTPIVGSAVLARISDEARDKGASAMLAEAPKLATDEQITDAFNDAICRISLGTVRVRMGDFSKHIAGTAADWRVTSGPGQLLREQPPVVKDGQDAMLLQVDPQEPAARRPVTVTLVARPDAASEPDERLALNQAGRIDRVYVSFQCDQSWDSLGATLIINGRAYKLAEPFWLAERKWVEMELRVPGHEPLPTSGRSFYLLEDAGPAPAGSPPLAVSLTFTPNTGLGAWWAKMARNYYTAFRQVPIWRYIATSASLAILTIILVTFGSSLSAYAFARLQFPGRDVLFGMLLATMMIPAQVTMIPKFLIFRDVGWYNTLLPLWAPAIFGSAFFIFLMRQFFMGIPKELEEAARMDGCNFFGTYWHIMLPLVRPTLVTIAVFAFMGSWNDFMDLLIYVNDDRLYNLAFGLYKFQLTTGTAQSLMMAGAFVMTLPIIALFFLFQRYFIQGISLSGLGGR